MVEALPDTVQRKLEQALNQWRHWTCSCALQERPRIIEILSGGRSNYSVRVASEDADFVVRIDGINPVQLCLNRNAEKRAQELAARENLAPTPCYFNPELGVLVSDWRRPDNSKPQRREELIATAELLRKIHQLPPLKYRLRVGDRARHYAAQLGGKVALTPEFQAACARLKRLTVTPVLCHNDLLAANRLWHGGRLLALDWEYAAVGDPVFELAVICEGDELTQSEVETLLQGYLQHTPSAEFTLQLQDNRLVYRELSRFWEAIVQRFE